MFDKIISFRNISKITMKRKRGVFQNYPQQTKTYLNFAVKLRMLNQ